MLRSKIISAMLCSLIVVLTFGFVRLLICSPVLAQQVRPRFTPFCDRIQVGNSRNDVLSLLRAGGDDMLDIREYGANITVEQPGTVCIVTFTDDGSTVISKFVGAPAISL